MSGTDGVMRTWTDRRAAFMRSGKGKIWLLPQLCKQAEVVHSTHTQLRVHTYVHDDDKKWYLLPCATLAQVAVVHMCASVAVIIHIVYATPHRTPTFSPLSPLTIPDDLPARNRETTNQAGFVHSFVRGYCRFEYPPSFRHSPILLAFLLGRLCCDAFCCFLSSSKCSPFSSLPLLWRRLLP